MARTVQFQSKRVLGARAYQRGLAASDARACLAILRCGDGGHEYQHDARGTVQEQQG